MPEPRLYRLIDCSLPVGLVFTVGAVLHDRLINVACYTDHNGIVRKCFNDMQLAAYDVQQLFLPPGNYQDEFYVYMQIIA